MKQHLILIAIASTCLIAGQAGAMTQDEYKVAKEKCDALSGDAKEACIRDAKLKYHQS